MSHPNRRSLPKIPPVPPALRRSWAKFTKRLLAIGGQRVVWQGLEPHLTELLERGKLFDQPVKRKPMRDRRCHQNAAELWAKDVKKVTIVTGYGWSDDGIWRPHSWILKNNHIYETTIKRDRYYGFELTVDESVLFILNSYVLMNGYQKMNEWMDRFPDFRDQVLLWMVRHQIDEERKAPPERNRVG